MRRAVWISFGFLVAVLATPALAQPMAAESLPLGQPAAVGAPTGESAPLVSPGDMTRTIATLGGVVVGILMLAWVAKAVARRTNSIGTMMGAGGHAPSGVLEVLGRYPVSRGQTLVLMKLDRRVLLLSQRPTEGLRTLCEITEPEEVASLLLKTQGDEQRKQAERFGGVLRKHAVVEPQPVPQRGIPAPSPTPAMPSRRVVDRSDAGDRVELLGAGPSAHLTGEDAARQLRERLARLRAGTTPTGTSA